MRRPTGPSLRKHHIQVVCTRLMYLEFDYSLLDVGYYVRYSSFDIRYSGRPNISNSGNFSCGHGTPCPYISHITSHIRHQFTSFLSNVNLISTTAKIPLPKRDPVPGGDDILNPASSIRFLTTPYPSFDFAQDGLFAKGELNR